MTNEELLEKVSFWRSESEGMRSAYEGRWVRNAKLKKGIPLEDKTTYSKVRNRSKLYFRKIWAISWRIVASFYQAFLREQNKFRIEGRDSFTDQIKAEVLQFMVKYREDKMMNEQSLFIKHIWAVMNMNDYGVCYGKLCWKYNPELDIDGPHYTVMPNEQVFPDLSADTPEEMRYVIFEHYYTKDQLEEEGYENLNKIKPSSIPSNQLRDVRFSDKRDPLQNPGENEYPPAGKYQDGRNDSLNGARYTIREVFYRQNGKIRFCVTDGNSDVFLKSPKDSSYGKYYPLVMGTCLTEANRLIGEGFPESMEGPQESYNQIINSRQDNVNLALNRPTIVSKYANVDLNALVNRTAGKAIISDDPDGVKEMQINDVTQSAYMEANANDGMMQDLSGVNASIEGLSSSDTATQSQINLSQGSAKIELYLAIGGETYFRSFYTRLAYFIQRFETNEKVFRVANEQMSQKFGPLPVTIDKVDDFDADIIINAGMAYAGREAEIRQALLVLDRGAIYNQTMMALMQTGAKPPEGFRFFDGSQIFEDLLPTMGKKEINKYFVTIPTMPVAPQGAGGAGGAGNGAVAGMAAPNVGDQGNVIPQNQFQQGSLGGY